MFNSYEFTFDGESSLMYGLMLYDIDGKGQSDVPFGNVGSVIETRTNLKIKPIHFGVTYNNPLTFKLVFGSTKPLDRYELETISLWLTGHQDYKWLSIDQPDMELFQFKCLITELTPISVGWLQYAFEANVICDCPYAYGPPFEKQYQIKGSKDILFRNNSSVHEPIYPLLRFVSTSGNSISIVNHSDGDRRFLLKDFVDNSDITIDNENGIITDNTHSMNLYDGFNLNFFRLVRGDNSLSIFGNGTLTISGRFMHNIAG